MTTATQTPRTGLLGLDRHAFAESFARRPFWVDHALADHPLLSLEALADLADRLPRESVERHAGKQPLLVPGGAEELGGRPSDTVREIEENGAWMVLWYIEQDPDYRRLLHDSLDEVAHAIGADHGMRRREGFVFLSAPDATTPVHFDPEHNLLLQIRGQKDMNVGRFAEAAEQQRELDRYHEGGHRNLERVPEDVECFRLTPGRGVYVHPFAPHFVQNGPGASVSLSITFRTRASERTERVHRANALLRRRGLRASPRPAGNSPAADAAKAAAIGALDGVRRLRSRR
jgi:hypothetical protein